MSDLERMKERIKANLADFSDLNPSKRAGAVRRLGRVLNTSWLKVEKTVVQEKVAETFPFFREKLLSGDDKEVLKVIIEFFGKLTFLDDTYDFLIELFLSGEEPISYYAADAMVNFDEKRDETKKLFFETLRESKNEFLRFTVISILSRRFKRLYSDEIKRITKKITREDKSVRVRQAAWKAFQNCATKEEVDQEITQIRKEALYMSLFEILNQLRPEIPVSLSRIISLTKDLAVEKAKGILERASTKQFEYSQKHFVELISDILSQKSLEGEYLELEQVFIRASEDDHPVVKPIAISKEYICYYCGYPIENESKNCLSCNKAVEICMVCKLPISFGEEAGKCSLCEAKGHMAHFQEWVKVKGKCPTCMKDLPIEGIVPLSTELKK